MKSRDYISVFASTGQISVDIIETSTPFDRALGLKPNDTKILINKGKFIADKLGKYQEAITYYDKALQVDANFVPALYNKGVALEKLAKHDEAQQYFEKANEIDPSYSGEFIYPTPRQSVSLPSAL